MRFLLSWAHAEPEPGTVDTAYLRAATEQIGALVDAGLRVFPDFHQDLYSRHLFDEDSWYTGDGAPRWAVEAGGYPDESCGICVLWGQNITQNQAVKNASRDFWHNTRYGLLPVQDAFLDTAQKTMTYLARNLGPDRFAGVVGFDPYNEPYAGEYTDGQNSRTWERDTLWPFYEKFRARMDAAGWRDKPAFVEPNMFWNANLDLAKQEGGLLDAGRARRRATSSTPTSTTRRPSPASSCGARRRTASTPPTSARSGDRATALGTDGDRQRVRPPAERAPPPTRRRPCVKAMYQALDSRVPGANWWSGAARLRARALGHPVAVGHLQRASPRG